jgi:hypothetical protein
VRPERPSAGCTPEDSGAFDETESSFPPDVFVVKGVANYDRPNYLLWEEGKGPDVTIEITSSSTKREDVEEKFRFYRDTLRVKEYFLFDPLGDYLDPPMQGYRLRNGQYRRIRLVEGRLPSQVLRLHLERCGKEMRLYDPLTHRRLPTLLEMSLEAEQARLRAEAHSRQAEERIRQAEAARQQEAEARLLLEAETELLRRELAELHRRTPPPSP